ncbi:MAG TPA: NAD-dependent epimerase/dehydratase family protein [Polyangia bacterium]|nr:NAD-dependent epimerase/dehydratase family protein [Polyangia bacterium]
MNALVTGGAGFIGSRLAARLLDEGHAVHAVDDLSLGRRENLDAIAAHPRFTLTVLDVRAPEFARLVESAKPDRVYHLAANSDISTGTSEPRTDLERTFLTTFHVLEAMRAWGARELVFASTSAIYGEAPGAIREEHGPLEPISLYGAAKLSSEAYVHAYARLYDLRAWVFRFPNVVGPNLTHGAIFDFVERLHRDRDVLRVLGDGTQTKPYLDVDDLLDAIAAGVAHPAEPVATYNIAGAGATSVREIAELVREELGLPSARIEFGAGNRGWPGDVPRFEYDTRRIRALGWTPRHDSREAVRRAIRAKVEQCRR